MMNGAPGDDDAAGAPHRDDAAEPADDECETVATNENDACRRTFGFANETLLGALGGRAEDYEPIPLQSRSDGSSATGAFCASTSGETDLPRHRRRTASKRVVAFIAMLVLSMQAECAWRTAERFPETSPWLPACQVAAAVVCVAAWIAAAMLDPGYVIGAERPRAESPCEGAATAQLVVAFDGCYGGDGAGGERDAARAAPRSRAGRAGGASKRCRCFGGLLPRAVAATPATEAAYGIQYGRLGVHVAWCARCRAWMPPRAYHCKLCDWCVLRRDHHCMWLATCVGERNYWAFISFLAAGTACILVQLASAAAIIVRSYRELSGAFGRRPSAHIPDGAGDDWGAGGATSPDLAAAGGRTDSWRAAEMLRSAAAAVATVLRVAILYPDIVLCAAVAVPFAAFVAKLLFIHVKNAFLGRTSSEKLHGFGAVLIGGTSESSGVDLRPKEPPRSTERGRTLAPEPVDIAADDGRASGAGDAADALVPVVASLGSEYNPYDGGCAANVLSALCGCPDTGNASIAPVVIAWS